MSLSRHIGDKIILLEKGDITLVKSDAIVNAANSQLAGGGGVDGAIHRAAGPSVMAELDRIRAKVGRCEAGKAVVTGAGRLQAQFIFHAVGPVYRGGRDGEPVQLASCYRECLRLAAERDLRTIAFPAISTGVYGYPMEEAAGIAIREIRAFLGGSSSLQEVRAVLFGEDALRAFERALDR
ncbi:MAG TPA: O-acetyl-ADP-ribose deacetylase [Bryobacteraceae bacterium]|nr:O-acetyl-ADP-ribose deacetylase [Bryobacteraceae bacterium]